MASYEENVQTIKSIEEAFPKWNASPEDKTEVRGLINDMWSSIDRSDPSHFTKGLTPEQLSQTGDIRDKDTIADTNKALEFHKKNPEVARALRNTTNFSEAYKLMPKQESDYTVKQVEDAANKLKDIHTQDEASRLYDKHIAPVRSTFSTMAKGIVGIDSDPNAEIKGVSSALDEVEKGNYTPSEKRSIREALNARVTSPLLGKTYSPSETAGSYLKDIGNAALIGTQNLEDTARTGARATLSGMAIANKYNPITSGLPNALKFLGILPPETRNAVDDFLAQNQRDTQVERAQNLNLGQQIEKLKSSENKGGMIKEWLVKPVAEMTPSLLPMMIPGVGTAAMYLQGAGMVYQPMVDAGIDNNTASSVSALAGIPFAMLNYMKINKILPIDKLEPETADKISKTIIQKMVNLGKSTEAPIVAEGLKSAMGQATMKYAPAIAEAATINALQTTVADLGYDIGAILSDDPNVKAKGVGDIIGNTASAFKDSLVPMAGLLLPGKLKQGLGYRKGTEIIGEFEGNKQRMYQEPAVNNEPGMIRDVNTRQPITQEAAPKKRPTGVVDWVSIMSGKEKIEQSPEQGFSEGLKNQALNEQAQEGFRKGLEEQALAERQAATEESQRGVESYIPPIEKTEAPKEVFSEFANPEDVKRAQQAFDAERIRQAQEEFDKSERARVEKYNQDIAMAKEHEERFADINTKTPPVESKDIKSVLKKDDIIPDKNGSGIPIVLIDNPTYTPRIIDALKKFVIDPGKNTKDVPKAQELIKQYEKPIEKNISDALDQVQYGHKIELVETDQIPEGAKSIAEGKGEIEASYARDANGVSRVYVDINGLRGKSVKDIKSNLDRIIAHEVKTHFGLDELFKNEDVKNAALRALDSKLSKDTAWLKQIAEMNKDYKYNLDNPVERIAAIEETLSRISEQATLVSRKVINMVKELVEKVTGYKFSDSDIRSLLRRSADAAHENIGKLKKSDNIVSRDKVKYSRVSTDIEADKISKAAREKYNLEAVPLIIADSILKAETEYKMNPKEAKSDILNNIQRARNPYEYESLRQLVYKDSTPLEKDQIRFDRFLANSKTGAELHAVQLGIKDPDMVKNTLDKMVRGEGENIQKKINKLRKTHDEGTPEFEKIKKEIIKEMGTRREAIEKDLEKSGLPKDMMKLTKEDLADTDKMDKIKNIISTNQATWVDKALEWRRNSLLSAIITNSRNIVGTGANMGEKGIVEMPVRATLGEFAKLIDAMSGTTHWHDNMPDYKTMAYSYMAFANTIGEISKQSWKGFKRALKSEMPDETYAGNKFDLPRVAISGKLGEKFGMKPGQLGKIIRIPQRFMLAEDEALTHLMYSFELINQAHITARKEGLKFGSKEMESRVKDIVNQGKTSPEGKKALLEANEATFKAKPGDMAQTLINYRDKSSGPMKFIIGNLFPFIVTPANIYKQSLAKIPGLGLAVPILEGIQKGSAVDHINLVARSIADQAIGLGILGGLTYLMSSDDKEPWITGNTPVQPGDKNLAYMTYDPLTVKIGNSRVSYKYLDPMATTIGTAVDMLREFKNVAYKGKDTGEATKDVYSALMASLVDKTFVAQFGDVYNIIQPKGDPSKKASNVAANWVASWVMPNIIKQPARALDPMTRSRLGEGFGTSLMYNIMPYDMGLMPKVDIWGRDVKKVDLMTPGDTQFSDAVWRMISPIDVQEARSIDNNTRAIMNWNNAHPNAEFLPTTMIKQNITREGITKNLNPKQFYEYAKLAGKYAKEEADSVYVSSYINPTQEDIEDLKKALSRGRQQAADEIFEKLPLTLADKAKMKAKGK